MKNGVQSQEVREALLDATDRLLARSGYKKMTIDELANEVGIGKGSVYLHFPSKEEIALSHVDRIVERLKKELTTIAGENISADKKIRNMLLMRVLFRFDSVQHYTQSLNDLLSALRPNLLLRRERYFHEESKLFASVIDEGISAGIFESVDSGKAAETLLLATNSLLPFSLSTDELGAREDIEARTLHIANLLIRGLSAK